MRFYNILDYDKDERERFAGLVAIANESGDQRDSHEYSYFHMRKLLKEGGMVMGLESTDSPTIVRSAYENSGNLVKYAMSN